MCDGHLAISNGIAMQLRKRWPQPVAVIYNPFDSDGDVQQCSRPVKGDDVRLLFIGRLHEQKRVDRILVALSRVTCTNWQLQVIGDGPERAALESLASRLNLTSRIEWAGWAQQPWIQVRSASLLLFTSMIEGFSVLMVEALARGVPMAAMDCDFGPREVIQEGRNGWLLPDGDSDSLAHLIDDICAGKVPLPSVEEVVATSERFRATEVVSDLCRAVRDMCSQKRPLGPLP